MYHFSIKGISLFKHWLIIKNERGFSAISALIGAAIIIIFIMALNSGISALYIQTARTSESNSLGFILNDIEVATQDSEICKMTFAGSNPLNYSPIQNYPSIAHNISFNLPSGENKIPITTGATIGNGIVIESIKIQDTTAGTPLSLPVSTEVTIPATLYTKRLAQITITVKRNDDTAIAPVTFSTQFFVAPSGLVEFCGADSYDMTLCAESGGVWLPSKPEGERCRPLNHCRTMGSYSETGLDNSFVNPFTNGHNCPTGSNSFQSGVLTSSTTCGKYCIRSKQVRIYQCLDCGAKPIHPSYSGGVVGEIPLLNNSELEQELETGVNLGTTYVCKNPEGYAGEIKSINTCDDPTITNTGGDKKVKCNNATWEPISDSRICT